VNFAELGSSEGWRRQRTAAQNAAQKNAKRQRHSSAVVRTAERGRPLPIRANRTGKVLP